MLKKIIQVISLIILMLALTACVSHPKEDKKETPAPIAGSDIVYFPSFPEEPDDIIPLDKDNNIIRYYVITRNENGKIEEQLLFNGSNKLIAIEEYDYDDDDYYYEDDDFDYDDDDYYDDYDDEYLLKDSFIAVRIMFRYCWRNEKGSPNGEP